MQVQERPVTGPESQGLYNPTKTRRAYLTWIEASRLDFVIAPGVVGTSVAVLMYFHHYPFGWIAASDRHALFQIALQTSVALAGFTLTSISVLVNLLRTPLSSLDKLLNAGSKRKVGFAFVSCLGATVLVFIMALFCFIADSDPTVIRWTHGLFLAAVAFAVLRFYRVAAILRLLLAATGS